MIAQLFSSAIAKVLSGIAVVLLAMLAVQSYRLDRAQDRIETLTAELALAELANTRMIEEGKRRTKAAKDALREAKEAARPLERDIARIRADGPSVGCVTPVAVLEAGL